ncbi:hypothetical protein NSQ54_17170 [Alkalihalobacillus sp. FSL W8-0930]
MKLSKQDFYFGALLSLLVKTGFVPAIIEEGESNQIYKITTNYDYVFYSKYLSKTSSESKKDSTWQFQFSELELKRIRDLSPNEKFIFAFVCGRLGLRESEIAFLSIKELQECLGIDYQTPNRTVAMRTTNGSPYIKAYGTGRDRYDQSLQITRNPKTRLDQFKETIQPNYVS